MQYSVAARMKIDFYKITLCFLAVYFYCFTVNAQSPGLIIDPKNGNGVTFLNPNGDKYTSATSAGFTTNDLTQSEIPYKVVPPAISEPVGDESGGSNGGPTDFVPASDGNGFYAYYDGTNIMFRFRVGGYSTGSKGYSVLIDTDLKIGATGFYADPNYIAPSASRSGNPGFELEIVYEQNKRVAIYNVDGTVNGTLIASYPVTTNAQTSVALTRTSGDADYFVDFGVPVSALGNPQYIRMVGTTVNSASSALTNNASDVFGVNDIPRKNLETNWIKIIENQCGFSVSSLSLNGSGICVCTPRPTVYSPIGVGTNVTVSGIWNRLDPIKSSQAIITLFKNSTVVGTVTATTGVTWSIIVPSIMSGDTLYAKAQAAPEYMCLQSDPVIASCGATPASPTITCASTNGIQGTIPLNSTVQIYVVTANNSSPTSAPLTNGIVYTSSGSNTIFTYYGSGTQSGNPCISGTANLATGTYYFVTNSSSCLSIPTAICIYGSSQNNWGNIGLNSIALTTPIYSNQTSISGIGATSGDVLRLYINNIYYSSITASGSSFTINNVSLKNGDQLRIAAQGTAAGACMTASNAFSVTCYTAAPTIFSSTYLTTDNSIGGYSTYAGAAVSLYKGTYSTGTLAGTTTVASDGTWAVTGLTLSAGETYYAVQNAGCNSTASNSASIVAPTVVCPTIAGSYTESSTSVSGTLPSSFTGTIKLYEDGVSIGSTNVTNATTWSIAVNQDIVYYTDKLYPNGVLTVTAQTPGSGEKMDCPSTTTVACDMPNTPSVIPSSAVIIQGQSTTFTITNSQNKYLYSLVDASNISYATSTYGNNGSQSLSTKIFNTPGTYSLKVAADNVSGPSCEATNSVTVTVTSALPIQFLNFSAKKNNGNVLLIWNVTNETNIKYYEIQSSTDCLHFTAIGKVDYQFTNYSANSYSFIDNAPSAENVCYRIIQVTADGKLFYSNIISISSTLKKDITLAPNPAKDEATLLITSALEQTATIELIDLNGKRLLEEKAPLHQGNNSVTLYNLDSYAKGTYVIKVIASSQRHYIKLLLE